MQTQPDILNFTTYVPGSANEDEISDAVRTHEVQLCVTYGRGYIIERGHGNRNLVTPSGLRLSYIINR